MVKQSIKFLKNLIILQKNDFKEDLIKAYRKIDKLELDFLNGYLEKRG